MSRLMSAFHTFFRKGWFVTHCEIRTGLTSEFVESHFF